MEIEKLHRIGFSLIALQPRKKQPKDDAWNRKPRTSLYDILEDFEDGCNIGFRPGVTSKTSNGYIHGIDLDIRVEEDRDEAIAKLEELFGRRFLKECARVQSGSGGSSRHFYFTLRRPMRAKMVAHSKEKFLCEKTQKMRWRWEIEVFGEGKQMVLPPSIHPDTGKKYVWVNPPNGDLPKMDETILDTILDELTRPISEFEADDLKPLGLDYDDAEDILNKLDVERWCVERDGWRSVGMALHHEFKGSKHAYRMWSAFSKKASNFDADEQRYQWGTFGRNDRVRPIRMATLMKEANDAAIREAFAPDENDAEEIREAVRKEKEQRDYKPRKKKGASSPVEPGKHNSFRIRQPQHLMTVPGMLGEIVDIYNASAQRPQPQFAVQAALAVGSVICGRNWRTDYNNYSSLYFLVLGRTASGKEHVLKVIDRVLMEAELEIVGPPRFTSDSGIMSALEMKPRQISLADEFSRYLKASRTSGDANQSNAQSSLMEAWGRLDGVHRNKGFSGRGMTKAQLEEMAKSHIKRPALSLVGVATPDDFYAAIGNEDVANGFLNRFLIVESEVPRLPMQDNPAPISITSEFRKWARENAYPLTEDDEDIMDAISRNSPTDPGEAVVIPFDPVARKLLKEIDAEYIGKMDDLDSSGLDGLYGRSREIIMRISLILARSCGEDTVSAKNLEWAREYVEYHTAKMETQTIGDMGSSDLQRIVSAAYKMIEATADDDRIIGLTAREITTRSKPFRNLDTRQREEVAKLLASDHGVVIRQVKREGSRKSIKVFTIRDEE